MSDDPLDPAVEPTPAPEPHDAPVEDAGTQALSEALKSSFFFVKILFLVLVAIFIGSSFKTVESNEVAVILRFGRPVGSGPDIIKRPGAHFVFPYPIDELVRIPVGESLTVSNSVGWAGSSATTVMRAMEDVPNDAVRLVPGVDSYTLTGDGNIIHVRAQLKYRITEPLNYVFNFHNQTDLLQNILDNALVYASAQFTAEDALFKRTTAFTETVRNRVEQQVNLAGLGVTMEPITVEPRAPVYVRAQFDMVIDSEQRRSRMISEAQGYSEEAVRKADGEAKALISGGITTSNRVVQAVNAEASSFLEQLPYYRQDPELFRQRLLVQTMSQVLTNARDKWFLPRRADGQQRELRLMLNREPEKRSD